MVKPTRAITGHFMLSLLFKEITICMLFSKSDSFLDNANDNINGWVFTLLLGPDCLKNVWSSQSLFLIYRNHFKIEARPPIAVVILKFTKKVFQQYGYVEKMA